MTRKFAAAVAALVASFGGVAADATPITVDFSVASNDLSNPSYGGAAPDFDGLGSGGIAFTDASRPGLAYGRPVEWSVRATPVPEPGTLALFGVAAIGLAFVRRRRVTTLP